MILLVAIHRNPMRVVVGLKEALRDHASYYALVMPGLWLVDSQEDAEAWINLLRPLFGKRDTLLVIRAADDYDGWLSDDVWHFLNVSRQNGDFDS